MRKVSYNVNGVETNSYTEAVAMGYGYGDEPIFTEFSIEHEEDEASKAHHRELVEAHIASLGLNA